MRAPAARAAASARQPSDGWRLWACTMRAPLCAHGGGDLLGRQAAAEQPGRGARAADRRAVARQQPRVLAEVLAHEPEQVLDDALLAARRAVAVVQEEDHVAVPMRGRVSRKPRLLPRHGADGEHHRADAPARGLPRRRAGVDRAAGRRRRRRAARRRRRARRGDARRRAAPRRALRRPPRVARAERRAQQRDRRRRRATCSSSSTTTSRCAPAGSPRCSPPTPRPSPTVGVLTGPDPRPLRGPPAALVRPRGAADHDAGPRPRRPRRRRTPGART